MASTGVRRRDTTRGPPLRILSLDGGGVRGYSMLIILQELMHRTYVELEGKPPRRDQIPKPCDVFDLIVGTGTGGLIALMLGRLRMDLETCKELYVRLTRVVFETDKTFAGIPYRSTLFKASKLESVIRECVAEHTVFVGEGNDGTTEVDVAAPPTRHSAGPVTPSRSTRSPRRHSSNSSVVSFSARSPNAQMARPVWSNKYGDPDAKLYDARETRTKTAVTAVYRGTPRDGRSVLLRSYDSRMAPPIEFDCKVWEAGRATCAVGLAFKPIQVGQSTFHDEGAGTFNPSPEALDEAVVNEWPGRDVGVFLSIGTGRRPISHDGSNNSQHLWYEGFLGGFAEARQRLIAKIENCETIHEYMVHEHLTRRNVNIENYFRLNVEMGVGEFGMNEWHRLSDISINTRRYLSREREQKMVYGISTKLAKIERARQRFQGMMAAQASAPGTSLKNDDMFMPPLAAELPAEMPQDWPSSPTQQQHQQQQQFISSAAPSRQSYDSGRPESFSGSRRRTPSPISPRVSASSHTMGASVTPSSPSYHHQHNQFRLSAPAMANGSSQQSLARIIAQDHMNQQIQKSNRDSDTFIVTAPTPEQYHTASGSDKILITGSDEMPKDYRQDSPQQPYRIDPPPIPPKTPLPEQNAGGKYGQRLGGSAMPPPYPVEEDEPPPVVNMAMKPDYRRR